MRRKVQSELVREDAPPTPVGSVVASVLDAHSSERMAAQHRAWLAWQQANGDRERAHTVYVALRAARRTGQPPRLVVGVDSHGFASDVAANKELYLMRLAAAGLELSGLELRFAPRTRTQPQVPSASAPSAPARRELTPEERAYVERMVANLPERIRPSASKALEKSILRKQRV